jgi:hypothetical protein
MASLPVFDQETAHLVAWLNFNQGRDAIIAQPVLGDQTTRKKATLVGWVEGYRDVTGNIFEVTVRPAG